MTRDELIAQLMQLPNTEVVFVKNVWSGLGACYDQSVAGGQVQWNGKVIVINVH
jgi:hypothetical protein